MNIVWKKLISSSMAIAIALLIGSQGVVAAASSNAVNRQGDIFESAAFEFKVPKEILMAIAYTESRGIAPEEASVNNGYGIMNLRSQTITDTHKGHGRGESASDEKHKDKVVKASKFSLDEAAKELKVSAAQLKSDDKTNVRGAAAVLAKTARDKNDGRLPSSLNGWYNAVALYTGPETLEQANRYGESIFATINQGASMELKSGRNATLEPTPTSTEPATTEDTGLTSQSTTTTSTTTTSGLTPSGCTDLGPGFATAVNCTFTPAAYKQNTTAADYGNYDHANRTEDLVNTEMPIESIIVHDTEGSYTGTISWFQNSKSYVSSHYVISSKGEITEMVRPNDIAWTAGNWATNSRSINIEHEGYAETGATWYTPAMYAASAKLVQYLADKYGIPMDREHIIGHDQVTTLTTARMSGQHYDPGPFWNWNDYMNRIKPQTATPVTPATGSVVTLLPDFSTNKPLIKKCTRPKNCDLPKQGTSVVYLRTQPSVTAPLVFEKYKNSGGAGTNLISDWSATATSGRTYVVGGVKDNWTQIWFGSQAAWFDNADKLTGGVKTYSSAAGSVKPVVGETVYAYGAAYPNTSDFDGTGVPVALSEALYTIPNNQSYPVMQTVKARYYYAPTIDTATSSPRKVVPSEELYYQISYNHRVVYVKASDVTLTL